MSRRTLSDEQKYQAVMDLLGGGSLCDICSRYGISQTHLYMLRDRALSTVAESVKNKKDRQRTREERLDSELSKTKQMIGDQAVAIQAFKKLRLTDI